MTDDDQMKRSLAARASLMSSLCHTDCCSSVFKGRRGPLEEWDYYEGPTEEIDPRVEEAEPKIMEILREVEVATDRELKVRLEKEYFPWVVGRAIGLLLGGGEVDKVGYPGRKKLGRTEVGSFYVVHGVEYDSVKDVIRQKKDVSEGIINVLTGVSPAADHAEDLFEAGFVSLGFKIHGRDVSEFRGRHARRIPGKEPPNVDFVLERDGIIYGVDVKNWIRYEWDSRDDVVLKVSVAKQLGVAPFIAARYVDGDVLYNEVFLKRGVTYRYGDLLVF
jgi:hypothetical protein